MSLEWSLIGWVDSLLPYSSYSLKDSYVKNRYYVLVVHCSLLHLIASIPYDSCSNIQIQVCILLQLEFAHAVLLQGNWEYNGNVNLCYYYHLWRNLISPLFCILTSLLNFYFRRSFDVACSILRLISLNLDWLKISLLLFHMKSLLLDFKAAMFVWSILPYVQMDCCVPWSKGVFVLMIVLHILSADFRSNKITSLHAFFCIIFTCLGLSLWAGKLLMMEFM